MKKTEQNHGENKQRLLGALLRIPYQALTVRIQHGLIAAGYPELHASHLALLQHIRPEGSWMSELAERTQMTKQAVNYLVECLEQHGYVERIHDPQDGRARIIRLTAQGRRLENEARAIINQTEAEWAQQIGTERMQQLHQTLQDLVTLLEDEQ